MSYWFTGDTHFGHANVIKYTNRPFEHVDEMNEALITNWNAVVQPNDYVYHLGDVALCRPEQAFPIIRRLNGRKHWVFGNHDKYLRKEQKILDLFEWAKDYAEISIQDSEAERGRQSIVLMHYAMRVWNKSHHGAWQLYGHSHGSLPDEPKARALDVGVDAWNYTPSSYEQIKDRMKKKLWKPIDHHKGRYSDDG